jgi:hypothetical protein
MNLARHLLSDMLSFTGAISPFNHRANKLSMKKTIGACLLKEGVASQGGVGGFASQKKASAVVEYV